ncbi:DUF927 domain-containing protein [Turicimonas muris]|uniref:DUF927 domain-containing protein n=1 Tax=Turicimonas muris TaxID=1796652 RepID=UPI00248BF696|nr:DUF927 domain-containing protein [Turicimonas muris]
MNAQTKKSPAITGGEVREKSSVNGEHYSNGTSNPLEEFLQETDNYEAATDDGVFKNEDNGLYFFPFMKEGGINKEIKKRITGAPLKVLYGFSSDNLKEGNFGITVEFKNMRGFTIRANIFNSQLQSNGNVVRSQLANLGLEITDDKTQNSKDRLISYLRAVRPANFKTVVTRTGWKGLTSGKPLFVLPQRIFEDKNNEYIFENESINLSHIKTKGTLKEWQDHVSIPALSSSRAILAICANLAGPLLAISNSMIFGIHLKGDSTDGKTTALKIGRSVIGYSDELETWRSTKNDLENTAIANNDLTLTLDEIGQSDNLRDIDTVVYSLFNGTSKGRMNRLLQSKPRTNWRIVVCSSGEIGIRDIRARLNLPDNAGAEIRLIELPSNAGNKLGVNESIPAGFPSIGEYGKTIKENIKSYHGTALEAFIKSLIELLEDYPVDKIRRTLNEEIKTFKQANMDPTDSVQYDRVAESFGLLLCAGLLASGGFGNLLVDTDKLKRLGYSEVESITGWKPEQVREAVTKCFHDWRVNFGSGKSREVDAIKEEVKKFLVDNQQFFWEIDAPNARSEGEGFKIYGWQKKTADITRYWIKPQVLDSQLLKGRNRKNFLKKLKDSGLLVKEQTGRGSQTAKTINGKTFKTYQIEIEDEYESMEETEDESEKPPF